MPAYGYAANNPISWLDRDGLDIRTTPSLRPLVEQAKRDPIIGPLVTDLDNDPNYEVVLEDRRRDEGGDSDTDPIGPSSCNIKIRSGGQTAADYYPISTRDKVWHELGHAWAFRQWGIPKPGQDDRALQNMRNAVMWENRSRMQSNSSGNPFGVSKLRRIHPPDFMGPLF